MVADARFTLTQPLRAALGDRALPAAARRCWCRSRPGTAARDYFARPARARSTARQAARRELARQAERAMRADQLAQENARLRALLELRPALDVRSQAAELLYEARRPVLAQGHHRPRRRRTASCSARRSINEAGVLGQVTRVYLQSSEVTLLIDKDAAIPVLNSRTQRAQRRLRRRTGAPAPLEMRFMAGNADVQVGDLLTTSGVDGVYPPGLPVAKVAAVDRKVDSGFARILLTPAARRRRRAPRARARADRPAAAAAAARRAVADAGGGGQGGRPKKAGRANDHAAPRRPAADAGQPALRLVHAGWSRSRSTSCRSGRVPAMPDFARAGAGVLERAPVAPRRRRRRLRASAC